MPTVYEPSREDKRRYTKAELAARVRLSEKAVEAAKQARQVGTPHPSQILDLKICDPAMGSGAFLVETCRQLGDELIKAWYAHDLVPKDIPPDEDEVLYARRLIAQRCLYGVDKNDLAVDLAKLSLWLVTLAKEHPFTFLDHCLRHGDSLVGLTRTQIIGFHWEPKKQKKFGEDLIQRRLDRATEARAKILNAREDVPYRDQESRLAVANEALDVVRMTGDACVSAFFHPFMSRKALASGSSGREKKATKRDREDRCDELFASVSDWYASGHNINLRGPIAEAAASLRSGEHPIPPFHWEIEFPEVFSRENDGFDVFVGNPPFVGGARIWPVLGEGYPDWLRVIHEQSSGKAVDLVAHFFRRTYSLLRDSGCLGLVATNTIAQGDTREAGLGYLCRHSACIYSATRRMKWPGQAAVIVSVVHVRKRASVDRIYLNAKPVPTLNSYLFPSHVEFNPARLSANKSQCFQGACVLGMGFTFDDADTTGVASPLSQMQTLIDCDPKNAEKIFPYIGGKEINTDPTHTHQRFVIDFSDMSLDEASEYPDLLEIVREKVKPARDQLGGYDVAERRKECWWQFGTATPALNRAKAPLDRVLVIARISNAFAPVFLPSHIVFNEKTLVFPFSTYAAFANIQSRVHDTWARFFGSTLKDDFQYTPGDCLETFPFPIEFQTNQLCESAGREFYELRAKLMVENDAGLTKTYNRFHDPHEKSSEIEQLRELHAAMDRAVLEAYGWDKLAKDARCEFLLDYEEEDDDDSTAKKSKKKKPWRLRWPDEFRDEVLARLLELNEQRAEEERLAGLHAEDGKRQPAPKRRGRKKPAAGQTELFG